MRPRPWKVLLWVLFVSLPAAARERVTRQGTVLFAGQPGGEAPVLYVAARLPTRVEFEDLLEPRVLLPPGLRERVEVAPLGARSLVVSPVRDLAEGERLLLPVTGRTEAGEPLTLTLALVTRRDEVDLEARVLRRVEATGEGTVARLLLAGHESGTRRGLALDVPGETRILERAGNVRARLESVLQVERRLFLSVSIEPLRRPFKPWRLVRVRAEAGCLGARADTETPLPVLLTSTLLGTRRQLHTFATVLPEGAGCFSLTLEEDGLRVLRFKDVRLSP